jgi:hypothetical protein
MKTKLLQSILSDDFFVEPSLHPSSPSFVASYCYNWTSGPLFPLPPRTRDHNFATINHLNLESRVLLMLPALHHLFQDTKLVLHIIANNKSPTLNIPMIFLMKRAFTPSSTGVTLYFIRGPCRCNNGRCVQLRSILEPAGTNRSIPRNYLCMCV